MYTKVGTSYQGRNGRAIRKVGALWGVAESIESNSYKGTISRIHGKFS